MYYKYKETPDPEDFVLKNVNSSVIFIICQNDNIMDIQRKIKCY